MSDLEEEMAVETEPSETIVDDSVDLDNPRFFINRELSLLEFQRRVLGEAKDETNPLLERVKFLSILGSNLDEFFMVRVSGLVKQMQAGVAELPPDGLTPAEQLGAIRKITWQLMTEARDILRDEIIPQLKKTGIFIYDYAELNTRQQNIADQYFDEVVFPVLTPLAFDPGHPFPHISNLSLNLAVVIRGQDNQEHFARIKVIDTLPRLVPIRRAGNFSRKGVVPSRNYHFVWLEQLIAANLDKLFPGMEIVETHPFRVTRDADMVIQELEAEDLLETMEQTVRQRRFGSVIRVTVNDAMPSRIREILSENLEIDRREIYSLDGPLGLSDISVLYSLDRPDLKYLPLKQSIPIAVRGELRDGNFTSVLKREDVLFHHPYDSFLPVVEFLNQAARDPDVLAIKQTLYRVGRNSPVVRALLEARQNGKQVAVLVELKARFDEESNIKWAHMLEEEGVHVTYGLLGLKIHSKVALVVRKENDHIRRYIHLATGNYNAVTAQLYEDIGMMTSDPDIGVDATDLFNYLTGYSAKKDYRKLLVAPINLRERMSALIQREINLARQGKEGRIIFKMNSLVDAPIIKLLYQASQAGVKIDLIVRGICCLRPGVPGVSENIQVRSVVGRFLEHSRIYYFQNAGNEEIYLGSADLMPRNINRRVEVLFPVADPAIIRYLRDDVLGMYLILNAKTRLLMPDGSYKNLTPNPGETPISIQEWLINFRKQ